MSLDKNAFPELFHDRVQDGWQTEGGMSLRDWFAGNVAPSIALAFEKSVRENPDVNTAAEGVAEYAYAVAAAMLRQRSENPQ